MKSKNFKLLQYQWPELYKHAAFAERYVHSDPHTTTIKLRCFAETLVNTIHRELNLPNEPGAGFFEKLKEQHFEEVVESPIRQKLHAIRCLGNKAAHGGDISIEKAQQLLKEAYLLGQWLYKTYSEEIYEDYPEFLLWEPTEKDSSAENFVEKNEKLAHQLDQVKQELTELQITERAAQQAISDLNQSLDQARLDVFRNSSTRASSTMNLDEESTRHLLSIEDAFAEYTLNEGQAELVKDLGEFLSDNTESVFLLKGYAGTGKTFMTKGLIEYFRSIGRNYVLAAPTGKASKVIAEKTKSPAFTIHKTIYSFKDVSEYKVEELDGTETYKFYGQLAVNEMSVDTVFIVDEASMISDIYNEAEFFQFGSGYLLRDFLKFVNLDHNDHRKKVIFIGDDAQLPPIGMNFSPALDSNCLYQEYSVGSKEYELTEVVRHKADSGVMHNAITLRNALRGRVFNHLVMNMEYPDIAMVEHCDLIECYIDSCGSQINGESIVIAHSNADVTAYNRSIRKYFFPGSTEVVAGDKVMAVSNSNEYGLFISNGDFGLIKQVLGKAERRSIKLKRKNSDSGVVEDISVTLTFRDVMIGFKDLDGTPHFFEAKILEDLLYSEQPTLSSDDNKALYVDFCMRHRGLKRGSQEFKNTLREDLYFNALRLKFGYAITCHKAQGSEWNHVFVKCKSNQSQLSSGYFRWLYTAITRTSKKLYLLDPPNLKIGSGIKAISQPGICFPAGITKADSPKMAKNSIQLANEPTVKNELSRHPPSISMMAASQADDNSESYGIPSTAPFLLALLGRVRDLVQGSGIAIDDISHNRYQEAYFFRRVDEFSRVDVVYNGKQKVTRLTAPHLTELSSEIIELLEPLKDAPIFNAAVFTPSHFIFEEDFLNEFHNRLVSLSEERGMEIQNVEKYPWNLRYSFIRESEIAVYDIYFNGKNRFTKCEPLITACSPGNLVGDVQIMVTEGLSA